MTNLNDTAFQEQAIAQWRDWRRFLDLHLQLLDVRSSAAVDAEAFEIADSAADREREIKRQLAAIPGDARALFERLVEERRQQVHAAMDAERRATGDSRGRPLDADDVERAALGALLDEAEGTATAGIGQVPMADGWYDVDAAKLHDVPDETRYRLAGAKRLPAARLAAIVGVVALGAAAIWLTRPGQPDIAGAVKAAVVVNDRPVEPWAPRAVTLIGDRQVTLPVIRRAAGADPQAAQWDTGAWPLTICAPGGATAGLSGVVVASAGDAPARTYAIRELAPEGADLIVAPCGEPSKRYYAAFQSVEPLPAHAVGETAHAEAGPRITLRAISVAGPGQDPSLPQGRARVFVTADAPSTIDWSRMNPTLRWPDGQDVLPSESTPREGGMTFSYLVPLFDAPIEQVQWRVTEPAAGAPLRWRARLDPPPSRREVVSRAVTDAQAQAERAAGALRVTLALTNTSDTALALVESDITIVQGGRRLPIPPLDALRAPLAAGERRAIELVIDLVAPQPITLSVGAFAFEIAS
jgi:hypothetical protein